MKCPGLSHTWALAGCRTGAGLQAGQGPFGYPGLVTEMDGGPGGLPGPLRAQGRGDGSSRPQVWLFGVGGRPRPRGGTFYGLHGCRLFHRSPGPALRQVGIGSVGLAGLQSQGHEALCAVTPRGRPMRWVRLAAWGLRREVRMSKLKPAGTATPARSANLQGLCVRPADAQAFVFQVIYLLGWGLTPQEEEVTFHSQQLIWAVGRAWAGPETEQSSGGGRGRRGGGRLQTPPLCAGPVRRPQLTLLTAPTPRSGHPGWRPGPDGTRRGGPGLMEASRCSRGWSCSQGSSGCAGDVSEPHRILPQTRGSPSGSLGCQCLLLEAVSDTGPAQTRGRQGPEVGLGGR